MLAIAALLALGACGKRGSPVAPGPAAEVMYPKTYPSR